MGENDVIKIAVQVGKGIAVHARCNPTKIVAVDAATSVAIVATAFGYSAYVDGENYFYKNQV